MILRHIHCRDFRCLRDVEFEPGPRVNIIRGLNAQGKTSLLEAVLFAATSKSHRTNTEGELQRHGAEGFHIALSGARQDREVQIAAHWWRGTKRFKVNGVAQSRLSDIIGRLPVVFFSPEDVELVKGGAGERRRFLDMEISQVDPVYLGALMQYRQALRQRNELLRAQVKEEALYEVWEVQLAQHGAAIIGARAAYVEELSALASRAHASISGVEALAVRYEPDVGDAAQLQEALARGRAVDLKRGQTQRGPHRDDMALTVADRPARAFGSQGQQKTAALALKLAEVALVRERVGEYPLLMLDEVLAELDLLRAQQLFGALSDEVQVFVTTTELAHRDGAFPAGAKSLRMEEGRLVEEEER